MGSTDVLHGLAQLSMKIHQTKILVRPHFVALWRAPDRSPLLRWEISPRRLGSPPNEQLAIFTFSSNDHALALT